MKKHIKDYWKKKINFIITFEIIKSGHQCVVYIILLY